MEKQTTGKMKQGPREDHPDCHEEKKPIMREHKRTQTRTNDPKPRVPAHARPPERNTMDPEAQAPKQLTMDLEDQDHTSGRNELQKTRHHTIDTLEKPGGAHQRHASEESAVTTSSDTTHRNRISRQSPSKNNRKTGQFSNVNNDADKCFCGLGLERIAIPSMEPD